MCKRLQLLRLFSVILFIVMSFGCEHNRFRLYVSAINCEISIKDLGSDIFDTPPPKLEAKADVLRANYGSALTTYSTVVGLGDPSDEKWKSSFILFASDLNNLALWDSVRLVWPSLRTLEEDLEDAFRYYLYYFPERSVPDIITCITAFNNSIIVDDSLLMISLDRYLGAHSKYYPAMGIFEYQSRKMTPDYAVSDCMYAWATTEWDYRDMNYGTRTLLTSMLHEAKLIYFTKCMMPELSDTVLFGFTEKQLKFCNDNEELVWDYLISHDLLFTKDGFIIRKFTGEAPFTSYFTDEAPGRTVVWTGYRIIEKYMKNNPKVSLRDLMEISNCQTILTGAKYDPD